VTFQEQVDRLVELGYPGLAGIKEDTFRDRLEPLRTAAEALDAAAGEERPGHTTYVVVVTRDVVDPYATVPLLSLRGKAGVIDRNHAPGDLATYDPLPELSVPGATYLLVDVDRGEEFCGVRPDEALPVIRGRGRTPLTIDEGIAVVTLAPRLLEKNACFMLSGSRRHDRRVPALWISQGAPKLGWCWDGNPHSWLGVASAGSRVA
jgi:Family of unknown function (DUF5701)